MFRRVSWALSRRLYIEPRRTIDSPSPHFGTVYQYWESVRGTSTEFDSAGNCDGLFMDSNMLEIITATTTPSILLLTLIRSLGRLAMMDEKDCSVELITLDSLLKMRKETDLSGLI